MRDRIVDWMLKYKFTAWLWSLRWKVKHPVHAYWAWRKKRWIKTLKVGDIVCDCRGKHVVIAEKDEWDDILTEDGRGCSLFHCCTPVRKDNTCHD